MNEPAANAFRTGGPYPVGAVVVKEKQGGNSLEAYDGQPDDDFAGVGGMIKRAAGYDPEFGDWEYFYFESIDKVSSGKLETCRQCHAKARQKDFIFGECHDGNRWEKPSVPGYGL